MWFRQAKQSELLFEPPLPFCVEDMWSKHLKEWLNVLRSLISEFTWVLVSHGQQLCLPCGEVCDAGLHLSSDILQGLGDGRLAVCAANTLGRGEELLYAGRLSHYSSQLVEDWTACGKMVPVEKLKIVRCSDWFYVFLLLNLFSS